jgi:hypothetical protein
MLILVLLGTVILAFAVPPVDDPQTAFNEADAPISLALPTSLWVRVVIPAVDLIVLPRLPLRWLGSGADQRTHVLVPAPKQSFPHSLQKLFCTFLI